MVLITALLGIRGIMNKIELVEIDYFDPKTYVLGVDDCASLRSREVNTLVHLNDNKVSKGEFQLAMQRMRASGPQRIITEKDSAVAEWFREYQAKTNDA